jgi:hypothetical protein
MQDMFGSAKRSLAWGLGLGDGKESDENRQQLMQPEPSLIGVLGNFNTRRLLVYPGIQIMVLCSPHSGMRHGPLL